MLKNIKLTIILCILAFFASFLVSSISYALSTQFPNLTRYYENKSRFILKDSPEDTREVIRIGYKENYGVIKSPTAKGYEGYGYEYINKILEYTEQNYVAEYIPVDWSVGLAMLENGELDFLVGANYTTERNRKFIYLDEEFCKDTLLLVDLDKNKYHINFDTIQKLQGSTICVQKSDAMIPVLLHFLNANKIQATVKEEDFGSIHRVKELGSYDFALTGSMQMEGNLNIVVSFDRHPVYIIANKDKFELAKDFNKATVKLLENDYLFKERLYLKYFDNSYARSEYISREDLTLLRKRGTYYAGAINFNSPLTFKTATDQIAGIFPDMMKFIEEIAGIDIEIIEITPETDDSTFELLDFSLMPKDDSRELLLKTSDPLINLPYVLVEKNIEMYNEVLGTLDYYGLSTDDINYFVQNQIVVEYGSVPELIEAFNNGSITNMFLTTSNFTSLRSEITVKGYRTTNLDYRFAPSVTFSPAFPDEKIEIFNKMLTHITNFDVSDSVAQNVARINQKDEKYYLHKYRYTILTSLLAFIVIAFLIGKHLKNQKMRAIRQLEDFDKLTGLFTYDKFVNEVRNFLDNHPEHEYKIISADIDNFRYINEIYGYNTGSEILQHIAYHLKTHMEEPLPLAVHAGDNFLILVHKERIVDKYDLSNRINSLIEELEEFVGKAYNFSFSIGIYEIEERQLDVNFMIDCANIARSRSKSFFGTSIEFFSDEMKQNYTVKNQVLSNVKIAFEKREFRLFYQPKFDINTMKIVGAEALIRWFQGDKMVPPDRFIPIIEGNGLIDQLDYYVVDAACRFIRANERLGLPKISINISGYTIIREEVVAKIIEITRQYGVHPSQLDMEITESAFVDNFSQAVDKINTLRDLGFTISMDDFGAGISSLNRLRSIPIDILKIDRGFIIDSLENTKGAAIIKNIIQLAKDIYVETVAEGIETTEQLEFLKTLGCDVGQGYYFSRPIPGKDFIDLLIQDREESDDE